MMGRHTSRAWTVRASFPAILLAQIATAGAGEVAINGRAFRVPDGFVVERVAGPPLVDRPIVADFDELGRLYVADSSGSNDNVQKQLAERPHRIVRLEDADGDGTFDTRTVFADKMMFPEGAMWRDGSLYVAAPPSIWKLTDTDGDGVADRREEWYQGKTLTGCANDLHGPYNGTDGFIYWCKGAFAEQTHERPGKSPLRSRASHIFRARADGSGIEAVMTGGMDNPVEIAFTPEGERIVTATFLQHPGGGRRDGLFHAVYGGLFGKDHDVLNGHPRTGPDLMPIMTHLGPAAPSGLMRYESNAFGEGYKDNHFAALFNLHKVTRHVLEPVGATFATKDEDFLATADDRDFHPTDVLEDADGSLLVIDTGGWYKLCCPTSQIGKPDVLGAIYRVRRAVHPEFKDPRGQKIAWGETRAEDLISLLDDKRPVVRKRAVESLVALGDTAVGPLGRTLGSGRFSEEARRNAVWAASRIESEPARKAFGLATRDSSESVALAAIHALGVMPIPEGERPPVRARLVECLFEPSPRIARAAAEALGRIGTPDDLGSLLRAMDRLGPGPFSGVGDGSIDRFYEHSIIWAIIEIGSPEKTAPEFIRSSPRMLRASLIARDQLGAKIPAGELREAFASTPELREVASWICSHHPEYGEVVVEHLKTLLDRETLTAADLVDLEGQIARSSGSAPVAELIAGRLGDPAVRPEIRLVLLRAMSRSGRKSLPESWRAGLIASIRSGDPEIVRQAVATAKDLPVSGKEAGDLLDALSAVAADPAYRPGVRLDALNASPGGAEPVPPAIFAFLRDQLDPERPVTTRLAAADVLSRSRLTAEQLIGVADLLRTAGPLEAGRLLAAFEGCSDDAVGRALVAALEGSPALASLRVEALKPRLAKFGQAVRDEAGRLYAAIARASAGQGARLDGLLATLPAGDVRRGQAIFNGSKAACTSCHAIGYLGGTVGPDLSSVGKVRSDRDLLEAILFPSASFVRSYEPMVVATKSGQVQSGILRKDSADEVVLAVAADKDVRIARDEIEEMSPGTVSVMPAGIDAQLSTADLADLLAFLRSRK